MLELSNQLRYIEFDYNSITSKKCELIRKHIERCKLKDTPILPGLQNLNITSSRINSSNYSLIDCDITNITEFNTELKDLKIDFNQPTIIIAECLLVYIKKEITFDLLTNFTKLFKNVMFIEYDLIGADSNFGKEMIVNLIDRGIKLYGYKDTPNLQSQKERLLKCGFNKCEGSCMLDYYNKDIEVDVRRKIEQLEFVDELEEWNLLQTHACICVASKWGDVEYEYLDDVIKLNGNNDGNVNSTGFDKYMD